MKFVSIAQLSVITLLMTSARAAPATAKPVNASASTGTKIVGGYTAAIKDFPYQLSLRSNGGHFCGASIINSTHGLTAAHCAVAYAVNTLSVRAGSASRTSGGTTIAVTEMVVHPKYDSASQDYDVAVFKVKTPFVFSTTIKAVALPAPNAAIAAGTNSTVSGWGTVKSGASTLPTALMAVVVPVVSQADCQASYGASSITLRMICAGFAAGGKDSCQGDSGGPEVATISGKQTLIGIVSWGDGCALPKYYGVYTNVASVVNWIKTNTI